FFFSSRRRHTRFSRDWSSDVCSSDLSTTTQPVGLKISVVVEEHHKKLEGALKKSVERTKRPPISHYGIRSEIEVVTYSAMKRRRSSNGLRLYYYPQSKPRKFSARGTIQELFHNRNGSLNSRKSTLPMLSNIAVDVSWASQN